MREDEEYCKKAFTAFLESHYSGNIAWADGGDPPDYYLELCGKKFAVEVTSIFEEITLGSVNKSHIGIDIPIKRFIEDIQEDAIRGGFLSGAYIVRYEPLKDFGKQKQAISMRIKNYLQRTQSVSAAPVEDIFVEGHTRWYISKIHSEKNYITRITSDAKWEGETVGELCTLLNKALETKTKKLENVLLPKILLLSDRFAWIDADQWRQYLPKLSHVENFHTIFLVSKKSNNSILCSIESSWLSS